MTASTLSRHLPAKLQRAFAGLGVGTAQFGNMGRVTPERDCLDAVDTAWELGLRFFDTAPHYGLGVSEQRLGKALAAGQQMLLIDVLGAAYSLPGAVVAPTLASPGSFEDRIQQQAAHWLDKVTGGRRDAPIVLYCSDPNCWLSYNAALRTVAAGYTNVYWYRGGLQAWQMAGLQVVPSGM